MNFWKNKIAMVTGGSQGLGWEIARELAKQQACVVLVARTEETLRTAAASLMQATGREVGLQVADVSDPGQAAEAVQAIVSAWGGIDVLVNVVGVSLRTKLVETIPETFRSQMNVNFFTAVNCTQAALPTLMARRGRVINIASLAAKTPWPLVGPYVTSKAALAAYSNQLRFEVPELGSVLLVCPGPIRRSDAGKRYLDSAIELGEAAAQPGAGVRLSGLDPRRLAEDILRASARGKRELIRPRKAKLLFLADHFSARLGDWLRRKFNKNR
jgi:uncharacterized protein